jgi:hypothetical protein
MSEHHSDQRGLGADFPGGGARFLLRLLLPAGRRDEFVGDLIEEAETVVLPRSGHGAAVRWFWWQAATSASPMHARRCAREVGMHRQRWIIVVAILVFGPLMALDAGMANAPAKIIALVALAVAIPAATGLLSGNLRIQAVATLVSTALLVAARLSSGIEFRWYAIPWIFFTLLVMNWRYEHGIARSGGAGGPAGPRPAT